MTEYDCDILVVGSGAGGLATAVAAAHHHQNVLVVEKEPVFGGTTARSGGWLWVPASPPARRAGVDDSAEKARIYLQHETGPHFNAPRVDAYLEHAPKAIDFFEQNTAVSSISDCLYPTIIRTRQVACQEAARSLHVRTTAANSALKSSA